MLSQQRLVGIITVLAGYAIKFTAYSFLTPVVLLTFGALVFVYITLVGPELPFLQYVSFLLPIDGRGNASINEKDIMNAFGLVTMAFFMLSVLGGLAWRLLKRAARRIFQPGSEAPAEEDSLFPNQNPLTSLKRSLIISSIVITIIYLVLFVVIPFAPMAEGESSGIFYVVFVIFYIVVMISNAIYIGIDTLSSVVLGWAWARVVSG